MIYYCCDICGKPAQEKEYTFPVKNIIYDEKQIYRNGTVEHFFKRNEREEIITEKFNLCPDCKDKIANFIGGLIDEFNQ